MRWHVCRLKILSNSRQGWGLRGKTQASIRGNSRPLSKLLKLLYTEARKNKFCKLDRTIKYTSFWNMPCSLYETIRSNICKQSTSKPKISRGASHSKLFCFVPRTSRDYWQCLPLLGWSSRQKSGLPCGDLLAQNNGAGKRNRNKVALTLNIDMRAMRVEWPTSLTRDIWCNSRCCPRLPPGWGLRGFVLKEN